MTTLILAIAYIVFLLVGELLPRRRSQQARWKRWSYNTVAGLAALGLSHLVWGAVAQRWGIWQPGEGLLNALDSPVLQFAALLLTYDLALYIWHRLNHRLPILWRYHRFHHLDTELDTSSALRFHYMELLLTGLWRVPLLGLLAPSAEHWAWVAALATLSAGFHHGRSWLPLALDRTVSLLWVTPRWHWAHHHPQRRFHDAHYSVIFSFWDRLFRSRSAPPDDRIGLDDATYAEGLAWKPLIKL